VNCHWFFQDCAQKLKVLDKKNSPNEILANAKFSVCLNSFFSLPLEVQTEKRQDSNLDAFLTAFSPAVRNLTCSEDATVAQVEVFKEPKKTFSHKMIFNPAGETAQVLRDDSASGIQDRLLFAGSNAQLFQQCLPSKTCQNFDTKDVLEVMLGFWRDDRRPPFMGLPVNRFPLDSFKWARKGHQLATYQTSSIQKCCRSNSCQQFFTKRHQTYERAVQKQRQTGVN
jgi:hypothetical protein